MPSSSPTTSGSPRLIDVSANGDIYVHDQGTRGDGENVPGNGVVALRDLDGDGRADVIERFSDHYGTGLQLRGDHLYLSTTTEVYRYAMTPGELVPPGEAELVVGGFPEQRGHAETRRSLSMMPATCMSTSEHRPTHV